MLYSLSVWNISLKTFSPKLFDQLFGSLEKLQMIWALDQFGCDFFRLEGNIIYPAMQLRNINLCLLKIKSLKWTSIQKLCKEEIIVVFKASLLQVKRVLFIRRGLCIVLYENIIGRIYCRNAVKCTCIAFRISLHPEIHLYGFALLSRWRVGFDLD